MCHKQTSGLKTKFANAGRNSDVGEEVNAMSETKEVKCIECRGIMNPSVMSLQLERGEMVLIFEDVPCFECTSCGQQEIPGVIAEEISNLAEYFVKANQTVKDAPVSIGRINIDLEPQATLKATLSYL
jgi:YgiT-type zinc finger domain-containing protein